MRIEAGNRHKGGCESSAICCDVAGSHDRSVSKHRALFYEEPSGFVDGVSAFALEGLRAGDHVLAAMTGEKRRWIEDELGDDAAEVEFRDAGALYERHGVMFRELLGLLAGHRTSGRGTLRVVAEQALELRQPAEVRDYMRYEAAANVAYDGHDVSVLCPYDAARLPAELLEATLETHPAIHEAGGTRRNERFVDPRTFLRRRGEIPVAPVGVVPHRVEHLDDVAVLRATVAARGRAAGLNRPAVEELALAVGEVVTNALVHGQSPRRVWSYVAADRFVCQVEDSGPGIRDPLVGYLSPDRSRQVGVGCGLLVSFAILWSSRATRRERSCRSTCDFPRRPDVGCCARAWGWGRGAR